MKIKAKNISNGTLIETIETDNPRIGVIESKTSPGETSYPQDYWIRFDDGKREPYSPWEFQAVSVEDLDRRIAALVALKERIKK